MTHRNQEHAEMSIRLASKFAEAAEIGRARLVQTRKPFVRACLLDEIARNERDRDHWLGEWMMDVSDDAGIRPRPKPAKIIITRSGGGGSGHYSDGLPYDPNASELMHYRVRQDAPGQRFRYRTYDPHREEAEL